MTKGSIWNEEEQKIKKKIARRIQAQTVYRKTVQCDTFLNALKEISLIVDDENENGTEWNEKYPMLQCMPNVRRSEKSL